MRKCRGNVHKKIRFIVKVARVQSELCTKDFFLNYEFSYEKCSEIFPEVFEPLYFGSERIFPPNFPPNFPAKNQKKNTDELLPERRENLLRKEGCGNSAESLRKIRGNLLKFLCNDRCVPPCAAKTCAVHPVFVPVARELRAANPSKYPRAHEAKC